MDLTVDKLEQMFQNVEVTLDCMFRRMRWEMQQQQEKDGSFPLDPLLPFEELEFFQKRLAALVGETREIRAQKQQTMAAITEKVNRSAQLAGDVQRCAAVPSVAALLPAEHHAEDAPEAAVPPSRPDARDAPDLPPPPAQGKSTRPGRGGAQDRRTGQSSAGAPPGPRGRRASTPPGGPLRRRRPPL